MFPKEKAGMMQNKKIAVTGGIGSGKSVFCALLRKKGFPVFSCDEIYRNLWRNQSYQHGLCEVFPECVQAGTMNKKLLAAAVFGDRKKLEALNAYAHPKIMQTLLAAMEGEGVFFAEVPLLFEGGFESLFDEVIALRRADDARLSAVAERDAVTTEEIAARMNSQFDPAKLSEKRCIIVENNGSLADLEKKAEGIIALLNNI